MAKLQSNHRIYKSDINLTLTTATQTKDYDTHLVQTQDLTLEKIHVQ